MLQKKVFPSCFLNFNAAPICNIKTDNKSSMFLLLCEIAFNISTGCEGFQVSLYDHIQRLVAREVPARVHRVLLGAAGACQPLPSVLPGCSHYSAVLVSLKRYQTVPAFNEPKEEGFPKTIFYPLFVQVFYHSEVRNQLLSDT